MRNKLAILGLSLWLAATTGMAAHTQAKLLLPATGARPGETVLAGVKLTMDTGWHTYWINPGTAGIATSIEWKLPPGITAGEIQWPLPEKMQAGEITTYGYEHETVLLVPLTLGTNVSSGLANIAARVSWLECQEQCVPGSGDVQAELNIGSESTASTDAAALAAWAKKIPATNFTAKVSALWKKSASENARDILFVVDWLGKGPAGGVTHADFFPFPFNSDECEMMGDVQKPMVNSAVELDFAKSVKKYSGSWPSKVSGVLVLDDAAYVVNLPVNDPPQPIAATTSSPRASLWQMLMFAFIGGLILNIMPCVLPVIALKILGFVTEAKSNPAHIRRLGLVYAAGVLVSFFVLASLVIAVQTAGHKAAWGMQFDNPVFVVMMTTLVTLVAMNLFGVFEVTLGGGAMDAANKLAARSGAGGAFFNGVLATLLATPCTAPFLAPALGFAFSQPAVIIVLVFLSAGAGLASPYVLLSWNPAWLKLLPKPGAWMEKFKMAMGFPMLATVMWLLLKVAGGSFGKDNIVWLGVWLVVVATAAWIFGEFAQRGHKHRPIASVIALLILVIGYVFALEKQLDWRRPMAKTTNADEAADKNAFWRTWSPQAVNDARTNGQPVLVDFTADWCLTCQLNARTSIEVPSVSNLLKELKGVAFKADYTHFPDNITEELNRHNRAGVPLVLVFPADTNKPPFVLPELLTENIVLEKLKAAAN